MIEFLGLGSVGLIVHSCIISGEERSIFTGYEISQTVPPSETRCQQNSSKSTAERLALCHARSSGTSTWQRAKAHLSWESLV